MPYSDHPPQVVVPDTPEGRQDAPQYRAEGVYVGLCDRFVHEHSPLINDYTANMKLVCKNREPYGDRAHNWCMRCQAGFPVWFDRVGEDANHRSLHVEW